MSSIKYTLSDKIIFLKRGCFTLFKKSFLSAIFFSSITAKQSLFAYSGAHLLFLIFKQISVFISSVLHKIVFKLACGHCWFRFERKHIFYGRLRLSFTFLFQYLNFQRLSKTVKVFLITIIDDFWLLAL